MVARGLQTSAPTPLRHAALLVLTGSCSQHWCFYMPSWKFVLPWSSSQVCRWDCVLPPSPIALYPSGPAAEGTSAVPKEGRILLTATLAAPSAPNCPSLAVTRRWRPSTLRARDLLPLILARAFGPSPGSACSGYSVLCQCSKDFYFHPKTQDKIQTRGKAQTASQPSTGAGAMNSSRVKSLFGGFLADHKCRNSAYRDEGVAKSLQGNICFKGGDQGPPAWISPCCHRYDQLMPSGLHVAAGMWHRGQRGGWPACCMAPPTAHTLPAWQQPL